MLVQVEAKKYRQKNWLEFKDTLAKEVEVVIEIKGQRKKLLASPFDLEDLVLGHAKLEFLREEEIPQIVGREKNRFLVEVVEKKIKTRKDIEIKKLEPELILDLSRQFVDRKSKWDLTGCFHRMAFWSIEEEDFILEVEDIGRHNCVDRLVGLSLQKDIDLSRGIFLGSARVTYSLANKLIKAGFKIIVSKSAVTTSGVALAKEKQITLIGFAREGRFTVFSDPLGSINYA